MTRAYSSLMGMLHSLRRSDLVIASGLFLWGLPDVPWWWEPPGHAGSTAQVLGALVLTLAMSVPFCWRRQVFAGWGWNLRSQRFCRRSSFARQQDREP